MAVMFITPMRYMGEAPWSPECVMPIIFMTLLSAPIVVIVVVVVVMVVAAFGGGRCPGCRVDSLGDDRQMPLVLDVRLQRLQQSGGVDVDLLLNLQAREGPRRCTH